MSIDKLEPFLGDMYQSRPDLNLFMHDRKIICDTHI